ncbi:hypothetical protein [Pseudonocardia sp. EV170527-09]|nr:hypothetical protein [Pseudonocardia sp. EV170527-09]
MGLLGEAEAAGGGVGVAVEGEGPGGAGVEQGADAGVDAVLAGGLD